MRSCDMSLQWRHNWHDGVSNHQPHHCLLNNLVCRRSKKISKLRLTGICAGNSPVTGEFPAQMASNAEKVSIWWRHHVHEITLISPRSWWVKNECYFCIHNNNTHLESWSICHRDINHFLWQFALMNTLAVIAPQTYYLALGISYHT